MAKEKAKRRGGAKLTAAEARTKTPGRFGDGHGLWLVVSPSGARRWVFRFTINKVVSELGLGSADVVSLAEARQAAHEARKLSKAGISPVAEKQRVKKAEAAAKAKPTFGKIADALIATKQSESRNERHRAQWRQTLQVDAAALYPIPVDQIDTQAVLAVLTPLWQAKPETASRLRGRIEAVLNAAKAKKHRSGENPATWRHHLEYLLPKRQKIDSHHAALPYDDVPAFVAKLRAIDSVAALALEFCILTAARSGEVLGARWSEIDIAAKVWTVPAERMKTAKEHRVPLADRALEILEKLSKARVDEFVFPGAIRGRSVSATAMRNCVSRLAADGATIHGFRSSFRDWCGEETHYPREIAEAALAHVTGDQVERAYRRGDALEKRRSLMQAWAAYLTAPAAADNVVPLRG
jgi:integrase